MVPLKDEPIQIKNALLCEGAVKFTKADNVNQFTQVACSSILAGIHNQTCLVDIAACLEAGDEF